MGLAQLRVEASHPLAVLPGDRFVIRGSRTIANHGRTLGGGEILRIAAPRYRVRNVAHGEALTRLAVAMARVATGESWLDVQRAVVELELAGLRGITNTELGQRLGLHDGSRTALIAQLLASHIAQSFGAPAISVKALAAMEGAMVEVLQRSGNVARAAMSKMFVHASPEALAYVVDRLRALAKHPCYR